MAPVRCCSSVNEALKSKLKSASTADAQGKVQPIRRLYACNFASGRDTAHSITSWLARCTTMPLNRPRLPNRTDTRLEVGPKHEMVDENLREPTEEIH